ncbi:proton-coupled amino acid transporter-like protein pathetic [Maniola jurtina]|uniref:proton-coupled amino acid transporter-like protein pathetic n=1 Tax=Maniola jurtina TaxID=191418 RepID=UPI001E68EE7A|nr:proton-coupled amino acid transporter-like protein pathetic [Maniola jurtina]
MTQKEKQADNFNSTADLTTNTGFESTLSIDSKDIIRDEKAYNPFEHREVEHPNSTIGATIHLLKGCLGSGILAMPSAFKNAGIVVGMIGTILAGVICTHTVALVVRSSQELCVIAKKPSMGFAETCGAAFTYGPKKLQSWGSFVRTVIDYSMVATYISLLCVYTVFIASSIKEAMDGWYPESDISFQVYCALCLVPLVLICQIRNLKYLVPFSATANLLIVVVFVVTMYYIFIDLPSPKEREMVASVTSWPLFFSTVIFAMEGIGVVMPVENEMSHPEKFLGCPGVLNTAMIIVISLYGVFGFFGYVQFGDAVKGSITLNLPQDQWVAQGAKLLMAVVIYLSFALQFYVPMEKINRMLAKRKSDKYENVIQIGIRTTLLTIVVAVAVLFPNLELVISLVGAIFFSTLGLLIPALIDTVYRWDRDLGRWNYILIKNTIIMIIAVIALVSGSYVSIAEMIHDKSGISHENVTLT